MAMHTKILIGLLSGAVVGVGLNAALGADHSVVTGLGHWIADPVGQLFLRLLFMVVMPLVFCSVVCGIAGLGDVRTLGRIGVKTALFFLCSTAVAVTIALVAVEVIRPGDSLDPAIQAELLSTFQTSAEATAKKSTGIGGDDGFGIATFVAMVPKNPVGAAANGDLVGVLVFAILFGIALTMIEAPKRERVLGLLDGVNDVCTQLVHIALKLAPVGVFCLVFSVTSRFGLALLPPLLLYVGVVVGCLLLQALGTFSIVLWVYVRHSPVDFLRRARTSLVTAFSTSSSAATLPTNIATAQEQFGIPPSMAGFVLPLGSTMCMNGTAIFEGITVLFLCQVFGVDLTLGQTIGALSLCVVTAIGAAGVPGGSIPLLVGILALFGVPAQGIAIILGVDRLLDMARTVVNVYGDLVGVAVVARSEGAFNPPSVAPGIAG